MLGPLASAARPDRVVVETSPRPRAGRRRPERGRASRRTATSLGVDFAHGGSSSLPSLLEVQAAARRGRRSSSPRPTHRAERTRFALASATEAAPARLGARRGRAGPAARVGRPDGRGGRAARPARGRGAGRPPTRPSAPSERSRRHHDQGRGPQHVDALAERLARRAGERRQQDDAGRRLDERERARGHGISRARQAEVEARLAVRTGEERAGRWPVARTQLERPPPSRARGARARRARQAAERASSRSPALSPAARRSRSPASSSRWPRRPPSGPPPSISAAPRCEAELVRSGPAVASSPPSSTSSPARCTATRSPAPSSGCGSRSWRPRRSRSSAIDPETLARRVRPRVSWCRRRSRCLAPRPMTSRPSPSRTSGPSRRSAGGRPSARSRCSARSTRWRSRSSRRWRSATSSSPSSSRTSRRPARPARHRQRGRRAGRAGVHARPTRTPRASSRASSPGCSPAARAGWC